MFAKKLRCYSDVRLSTVDESQRALEEAPQEDYQALKCSFFDLFLQHLDPEDAGLFASFAVRDPEPQLHPETEPTSTIDPTNMINESDSLDEFN